MNIELCCAEEVAQVLGIEVDTLYRYARKGRIRGMKVGKAWRFLPSDVQKFLDQNAYSVKSPQPVLPSEIPPCVLPDVLRHAALPSGAPRSVSCGFTQASYSSLDQSSSLLADSLLGHGIVPGDRVLILLPNSVEFIAACFAVWKAGAVVVAEDPAIKDEELRHILRDCAPEALIVDRPMAERWQKGHHRLENLCAVYVKDHAAGLSGLNGLRVESLDMVFANDSSTNSLRFSGRSPEDTATITYPRNGGRIAAGVMNTHAQWLAGAAFTREFHGVTQNDTAILLLPLYHSQGLRQMVAYLMAGAGIILTSDLNQAAHAAKNSGFLALALRPEDVKPMLETSRPALQKMAASVRYVEIAAAPLEEAAFAPLRQLLPGAAIHMAWNLTQAHAAYLNASPSGLAEGIAQMPPALKMVIIDEQGRETPPGQPGLIQLKGPGLMQGFWGHSEYQMAHLQAEGHCLGSHALTDPHGEIVLLGQIEETLEIRGNKVKASAVEAVLRRHIRVSECAVLAILEPNGQPSLHAFVVLTAKGALLTETELTDYCRTFMEPCMVPAQIHFRAALPKGSDGQILRNELRTLPLPAVKRSLRRTKREAPALMAFPS